MIKTRNKEDHFLNKINKFQNLKTFIDIKDIMK